LFTQYYWGDQIEENEIGGACSTYGEVYTGFLWGSLREIVFFEDPGVDGRKIL
jgi:hypothetical protein